MIVLFVPLFLWLEPVWTINLRNIVPKNRFIGEYACRTIIKAGLNPQSPFLLLQQIPFVDCLMACKRHPDCLSASYLAAYFHKESYCLLARHTVARYSALHKFSGAVYFEFRCPTGEKLPKPQEMISHGHIPSICGKPQSFESTLPLYRYKRIEGGQEAQPYSVPWLGQVVKGTRNTCGTTLVAGHTMSQGSTIWALTAAHCFRGHTNVYSLKVDSEPYSFIFGVYDLRYPTPHIVVRKASSITIHQEYDYTNNDIAVVKFDRKLFFNDYVRPACLPSPDTILELLDQCVICGYGRSFDDEHPDRPSCIPRNFVLDSRTGHVTYHVNPERTSMSFSYDSFEVGASYGDSGGPFMCSYAGWRNVLAGVVVSRMKVQVYIDDKLAKVNMYAHVPFYVLWILQIINAPDGHSPTEMSTSNSYYLRACWGSFAKSCSEDHPANVHRGV